MNLPLKILSAKQIRKADLYTIENEAIKSIDLMQEPLWNVLNGFRINMIYLLVSMFFVAQEIMEEMV